jgi:hypothetical protein
MLFKLTVHHNAPPIKQERVIGKATSLIHHCIDTPCCSGNRFVNVGTALGDALVDPEDVAVAEFAAGLAVPVALMPPLPEPLTTDVCT